MEKENIECHIDEYFQEPEITSWIYDQCYDYKDQFGSAESMDVYIEKIFYNQLQYGKKKPYHFSDNGKNVNIVYEMPIDNTKSKTDSFPEQSDFFDGLRKIFDLAVKKYSEKFPS